MVDFRRGQMGIFGFKRFYEDIRGKLQQVIKADYSRTTRLLDTPMTTPHHASGSDISSVGHHHHQHHHHPRGGAGGHDDLLRNNKNALKRTMSNQF